MTDRYFQALCLMNICLSWISSLHSCADVAPLHSRGCDCHRPVGSGGPHWLLGADHCSPSVDLRGEAGVLGGEDRLGALAFRTDGDRQDCHCRDHGGSTGRPGAGMRPVDSAHFGL